jgi:hypothetical protein
MKHAGPQALAALEPLLRRIRGHSLLVERTPGSFYYKSKAFLHFHEDPTGTYADIKLSGDKFTRIPARTSQEHSYLLSLIAEILKP